MVQLIANEDLTPDDIPEDGSSWSRIVGFARTYNGYAEAGGFVECGEMANSPPANPSLSELRTCLFFEYRRHNHFGYPPDNEKMKYINEILGKIREALSQKGLN